jgi:hypothetical protein
MMLLRDVFRAGIISKDIWPSQSPDLTPADYHMWEAIKGIIYKASPHTLLELQEFIANLIRNVPLTKLSHLCKQDV